MKITAPNYYKKFVCIADKCIHCCCIGWEIEIDDASSNSYINHDGELKKRFETGVSSTPVPRFVQQKDGRCPFLNSKNLCDIFIHMGEKSLCQVCTDHPRFRNFYSSFTEMGLGLCCEEAARIVLSHDEDFSMTILEDDGTNFEILPEEEEFFNVRQQIFDILDDKNLNLHEKFGELSLMCGVDEKSGIFEKLISVFENLEYMETVIPALIGDNHELESEVFARFENVFKNLAIYFVFRNFADALDDGMYIQRLLFALLSTKAVALMSAKYLKQTGSLTFEDLADFARIYSTEIEYSDKNIPAILDKITEEIM